MGACVLRSLVLLIPVRLRVIWCHLLVLLLEFGEILLPYLGKWKAKQISHTVSYVLCFLRGIDWAYY